MIMFTGLKHKSSYFLCYRDILGIFFLCVEYIVFANTLCQSDLTQAVEIIGSEATENQHHAQGST